MKYDKFFWAVFFLLGLIGAISLPIIYWFGESYSLPEWIFQKTAISILLICVFTISAFLRNALDGLARKIWFLIIPAWLLLVLYASLVFLTYWFTTSTLTNSKPIYLTDCYMRTVGRHRLAFIFMRRQVTDITFEDNEGNQSELTLNSVIPCPIITSTHKEDRQIVLRARKGIFGTVVDSFEHVKPTNKTN